MTTKRSCSFQSSWAAVVENNKDGIDEKYDWVIPVPGDPHKAKCALCYKIFSIASGGFSACRQHADTDNHRKLIKSRKKSVQTKLFSAQPGGSPCLTESEQVANAEILRALDLVECNHSFASAAKDSRLYKRMFPIDPVAKKYQMGETKVKYTIQFGISPYIKSIILKDVQNKPFSFKFDESTTSQTKKQYDGYITYYSSVFGKVITIYLGSLFVGHCKDQDLVDHFYTFMTEFDLDTDYLLALGMDGPNVNKSFERKLRKDLKASHNVSFLDLGTCPLHITNNSFGEGMKIVRQHPDLNIETFFNDIYFFFKLSSARREDFKDIESITDVTAQFMLKYSSTRWLYIGKVCVRVLEQFANLKEYFLVSLPKTKDFNYKNGVGKTERYKRIKSMLENDLVPVLLAFVVFISNLYSPFVLLFQREEPLIHILHPQMKKLIYDLLVNFIDDQYLAKCMSKDGKEITLRALNSMDLSNKKSKIIMGSKAKDLSKALDPLQQKRFIDTIVEPYYTSCTKYLMENLPLNSQILLDVKCLNPLLRKRSTSIETISRLSKLVLNCLGEGIYEIFNIKKETTVDELVDVITAEYRIYQIENITDKMVYKDDDEEKKASNHTQYSYWKYAYGIAGIDSYNKEGNVYKFKRIDDFWTIMSKINDPSTGALKFKNLFLLASCVLVLPHGNAEPERGFSINKHLLDIHGSATKEDTLIALRMVKDWIVRVGGVENIVVTKELMKFCYKAREKYMEHLRLEKEKKELKAKKEKEAATALEVASTDVKLKEELRQHKNDLETLKADINNAESVLKEGNKELSVLLKVKNVDRTKMKICQTKMDMAIKRKDELEEEVKTLEREIGIVQKKLKH